MRLISSNSAKYCLIGLFLGPIAAATSCTVVPGSAPKPHQVADESVVTNHAAALCEDAANAIQMVDNLMTALASTVIKPETAAKISPYSLLRRAADQIGVGTLTRADALFTYRTESNAGSALSSGKARLFIAIDGNGSGTAAQFTALRIEIAAPGSSLRLSPSTNQSFSILTGQRTDSGSAYTIDFDALAALAAALSLDNPEIKPTALLGKLHLGFTSGVATLTGDNLTLNTQDFAFAIKDLQAESDTATHNLHTLILDAHITTAAATGDVVGDVAVNTQNVRKDDMILSMKLGFVPNQAVLVPGLPNPASTAPVPTTANPDTNTGTLQPNSATLNPVASPNSLVTTNSPSPSSDTVE